MSTVETAAAGVAARETTRPVGVMVIGPLPPPFIGPAIATQRLIASPTLRQYCLVEFLNTSDPDGFNDIGKLSFGNVWQALKHSLDCLRLLYRSRPQVVYIPISRGIWGFLRDLVFIIPARLSGASVVAHFRAGRFDLMHDSGWVGRLVARVGLGLVNYGVVLGECVRSVFGDLMPQERIRVVPNGINLDAWQLEDRLPVEKKSDVFEILYLGNLFHDKGAHVLLRALPLVLARVPNLHVTFAGDWYVLAYRDYCMDLIKANGIERWVDFVGRVEEEAKKDLLRKCDVSVFVPVQPEGLPWVVLEAMASARPVIGSPQGTIAEVIVDGECGYIVPSEDAEALADRIVHLAFHPAEARAMGRSGRRRIEEVYSERATHRRLASVIHEAAGYGPIGHTSD